MSTTTKIVLIVLTLGIGYYASDIYHWSQGQQVTISLDDYCFLSTKPCTQNNITVTLDRDISHPLTPTNIKVEWPSTKADSLLLKLEGYEMEMGTTIFKLTKDNQDNLYTGELVLPVCTVGDMTWIGSLSDGNVEIKTALRMEK